MLIRADPDPQPWEGYFISNVSKSRANFEANFLACYCCLLPSAQPCQTDIISNVNKA